MKTKLKINQRISAEILRTELSELKQLIEEKNYGYAEQEIIKITNRLDNYNWENIRKNER